MYEMKLYSQELSKEFGITIVLARTPAETTAQKFAVSDLLDEKYSLMAEKNMNGDIETAKKELQYKKDLPVYYTNGTHIPVSANISIVDRICYEQTFFPIVDGGNILHIWLGEGIPDTDGLQELAMHIAQKTQTGYFAFTRDLTVCKDEGFVSFGINDCCPKCKSYNIDHLSRITGYLQSVSGWNAGKKQELIDRNRLNTMK